MRVGAERSVDRGLWEGCRHVSDDRPSNLRLRLTHDRSPHTYLRPPIGSPRRFHESKRGLLVRVPGVFALELDVEDPHGETRAVILHGLMWALATEGAEARVVCGKIHAEIRVSGWCRPRSSP